MASWQSQASTTTRPVRRSQVLRCSHPSVAAHRLWHAREAVRWQGHVLRGTQHLELRAAVTEAVLCSVGLLLTARTLEATAHLPMQLACAAHQSISGDLPSW